MPTITPQGRATIGGNPEDFRQPRASLKAATGMTVPSPQAPIPAPESQAAGATPVNQTGQSGINEDTARSEVTLPPHASQLARLHQKYQRDVQALREERETWEKERGNYVPKGDFKAKAQQNAVEALKELGTDYEELTALLTAQLNGADPVQSLKSEIDQLKKTQEENTNKQYEATIKQYKTEVVQLVEKDQKAYHFIAKGNHADQVVQHIVETWEEDPDKILTVEQAAKEIEEYLREEAKEKAALLRELEPAPSVEETTPVKKTLPPPQRSAPRTLTNQVETTPTRTYGQFQHMSMKERIAQATARATK